MTEYNYDRHDVYPPDFRDEYRVRHFDQSYAETMYHEYHREMNQTRRSERVARLDMQAANIVAAAERESRHSLASIINQRYYTSNLAWYFE